MIRFAYDTNCLIALTSAQHEHFAATDADWSGRRARGEEMVTLLPCVIEAYSVLTRAPFPLRLDPHRALAIIEDWVGAGQPVDLEPPPKWKQLRACGAAGIVGGQVYDALIAACARQAGAALLVTWNLRHFARFGSADLAVVTPSATGTA